MNRFGIGYDVHALVEGRPLILGCITFDDAPRGLDGHSDADVVAHAVCDALLGAAAMGDIGEHFPPSDSTWKDYPGSGFLQKVSAMLRDADWQVHNIDCVVMCDAIKLGARKKEMAAAMAKHLGIEVSHVNVKATTFEGHGAVGRGEIIACEAIASIVQAAAGGGPQEDIDTK